MDFVYSASIGVRFHPYVRLPAEYVHYITNIILSARLELRKYCAVIPLQKQKIIVLQCAISEFIVATYDLTKNIRKMIFDKRIITNRNIQLSFSVS